MLHPPLDAEYQALLLEPHISHNSRLLNSALALGSQGTFPSREQGGLGMHEQYAAFLSLFGKSYLAMRSPHDGCSPFDNHLLPSQVLFDGAAEDYGEDYAGQLLRFRNYLHLHHPLSRRLRRVIDMPEERISALT